MTDEAKPFEEGARTPTESQNEPPPAAQGQKITMAEMAEALKPPAAENAGPRTYRLKPGFRHAHRGRTLNPGDTMEMTDRQFQAVSDRFELVQEEVAEEEEDEARQAEGDGGPLL